MLMAVATLTKLWNFHLIEAYIAASYANHAWLQACPHSKGGSLHSLSQQLSQFWEWQTMNLPHITRNCTYHSQEHYNVQVVAVAL